MDKNTKFFEWVITIIAAFLLWVVINSTAEHRRRIETLEKRISTQELRIEEAKRLMIHFLESIDEYTGKADSTVFKR